MKAHFRAAHLFCNLQRQLRLDTKRANSYLTRVLFMEAVKKLVLRQPRKSLRMHRKRLLAIKKVYANLKQRKPRLRNKNTSATAVGVKRAPQQTRYAQLYTQLKKVQRKGAYVQRTTQFITSLIWQFVSPEFKLKHHRTLPKRRLLSLSRLKAYTWLKTKR